MYFLINLWRISLPLVAFSCFGSHALAQLEPPELAKEETTKSTDLSTDVPQGIENIGRDMIVLVDQIIFGEQDPTRGLILSHCCRIFLPLLIYHQSLTKQK